jgi:antitoxin CptB
MDSQHISRLRWQSRRGMRELDMLLMRYLDRDFENADAEQQAAFETLLNLQDPEILSLLTGRVVADDANLQYVVKRLLTNT